MAVWSIWWEVPQHRSTVFKLAKAKRERNAIKSKTLARRVVAVHRILSYHWRTNTMKGMYCEVQGKWICEWTPSSLSTCRGSHAPSAKVWRCTHCLRDCKSAQCQMSKSVSSTFAFIWSDSLASPSPSCTVFDLLCSSCSLKKSPSLGQSSIKFHRYGMFWVDYVCAPVFGWLRNWLPLSTLLAN